MIPNSTTASFAHLKPPDVDNDPRTSALPLAVDLDGTLLRSDLLVEAAIALMREKPLELLRIFARLPRNRVALLAGIARAFSIEVSQFPVNPGLIALLRKRRALGWKNVLVTAADRVHAEAAATHFRLFDEVLASDGAVDLEGHEKAQVLASRFPNGFTYAGNAMTDLPVWNLATRILAVNASPRVIARARLLGKPLEILDPPSSIARAALRAMRPWHWAKNALVFVPVLTSHRYLEAETLALGLAAAIAFSLVASAMYLFNDVLDAEHDRRHAVKRARPIAVGDLSITHALLIAAGLALVGLAFGFAQRPGIGLALLAYVGTTFVYSVALKAVRIVDVLVLSVLYVLRIIVGIIAIDSEFSIWLLAFAGSLFLSLSLAKRYTEVRRYGVDDQRIAGRGYAPAHAALLMMAGLTAGLVAIVLFALYLREDTVATALYARSGWLWAIVALTSVWIARIWQVAARGELDDDPVDYALRDKLSLALGAAVALAFFVAG